jgi:hypothetical protein
MEETISRIAGSENGSAKTVEELTAIAQGIGRPARQRTTTYGDEPRHDGAPQIFSSTQPKSRERLGV